METPNCLVLWGEHLYDAITNKSFDLLKSDQSSSPTHFGFPSGGLHHPFPETLEVDTF